MTVMTRTRGRIAVRKRPLLNGALAVAVALLLVSAVPTAQAADLLGAARDGDAVELRRAISGAADLQPDDLARPLFFASRAGHADAVALLLDAGADPGVSFHFGAALHAAARADHVEVVRVLLEHGASSDMRAGESDLTPLHEAAATGALGAARLLIERGAEVHARDKRGQPPIHVAVRRGRGAMATLLRESGGPISPPPPVSPAELAAADRETGRNALRSCNSCHEIAKDASATGVHAGPSLIGVFGRPVAGLPDYDYSPALRQAGGRWTVEALNAFIADPTGTHPGTGMLRTADMTRNERVALIAYMQMTAR